LYARIAAPLLHPLQARLRFGMSIHVAGGFTFTKTAAEHFADTVSCSFQEEACIVCMLQGLAPWDTYIRERLADNADPMFAYVIGVFFGGHYYYYDH
jgi:hypothetical protein